MGYERLISWGFDPAEIPLGTYIYESASGQDPIYGVGMLYEKDFVTTVTNEDVVEIERTAGALLEKAARSC